MRVALALLLGLLAGFAGAFWFFAHGGNVIVDGRAAFPPLAAAPPPAPAVAPAPSRTSPAGRRVVVRDVTDEIDRPTPPAAIPDTPLAAPPADLVRYEIGSLLVLLVPRVGR